MALEDHVHMHRIVTTPTDQRLLAADTGRSHTARVVGEIGRAIVSGRYPEGALLPGDAELMQQFGVSRTVLREALRTLAGKGLIQPRARVGTRVLPRSEWNLFDRDLLVWQARQGFDAQFLAHLSEMRQALEPEAAALAAVRRTDQQLEDIHGHLARMSAPEISREDFAEADLQLHLAISVAADNPFLRSIAALIEVALMGLLTISSPADDPAGLRTSIADHRAIADAIAARDPEAARAAMKVVIAEGVRRGRLVKQWPRTGNGT